NLSWAQIQAKAKAENKYILMDTYATWCGPCKQMSAETFPQKEAGDFINDKFVSVKVQMDQTAADNDYVKSWYKDAKFIGEAYQVRAYPTVLYFSPAGKMVYNTVGFQDVGRLINEAKTALKNDADYADKLDKFKKGILDTAAMRTLVTKASELKDWNMVQQVADKYVSNIAPKDMFKRDNLVFMGRNLSSKSSYFNLFWKSPEKVNAIVNKNYAEGRTMDMINREEIAPFDKDEKPDWNGIEKKVVAKYGKLGEEQVWANMAGYYWGIGMKEKNWVNYGKYYKKYFDRAIPNERSALHINNMSWSVFEYVTDATVLSTAIKAMEFNLDKYERYQAGSIDTYANLLYKAGRKDDALYWEEIACRLSNREKGFVETLEKMKAGTPTWPVEDGKQ
ncbi:thioredoxin family protein, partial [Pedobacter steynii]